MNIFITGATGYIGRYLVKRLVSKGHYVSALVRKNSNIRFLKRNGVNLIFGDLLDRNSLRKIPDDIDIVFHLAGEVYPKVSENYFRINVLGTSNILKECTKRRIKRFIYLSTTAVFGPFNDKKVPLTELSDCKPLAYYARTKLKGEKIVRYYYENERINVTIIRISVIYGPGLYPFSLGSIVNYLINKPVYAIIGRGFNSLPLCHVCNAVQGLMLAMENKNSDGQTFIISDGRNYTQREACEVLSAQYPKKQIRLYVPKFIFKLFFVPALYLYTKIRKYRVIVNFAIVDEFTGQWPLSIRKAESLLGYHPEFNFCLATIGHMKRFKFESEELK